MWTESEASGVIYSCTGTLCRHKKKKRGQHEGQKIFSLTLNKGIVKSTFPFHIILFIYEHLVVWTDVLTSLWQKHTLMCIMTQNKCREPLNRVKIVHLCSQGGWEQHLSCFRRKVLHKQQVRFLTAWRCEPEELRANSASLPLSLSLFSDSIVTQFTQTDWWLKERHIELLLLLVV